MASPRRRQSATFGAAASHDALASSLRQLSLSTGPPGPSAGPAAGPSAKARSPSKSPSKSPTKPAAKPTAPLVRTASVSSATSQRRSSSSAPQPIPPTPGRSASRASRSATPALHRKASHNSLLSAGAGDTGPSPHKVPTRRASSSNLSSSSPRRSSSFEPVPEDRPPPPPPPTAASIARAHFQAELAAHHRVHGGDPIQTPAPSASRTVVILQDNCYGHRFSRPRTSRANLSTIVERPERIQACAVGVSVAYVRLGGRHAGGAYMPHPRLNPAAAGSLPSVPFRIHKTARTLSLLAPAVANVHGVRWMEELKMLCDTAEAKLAHNGKELQRPEMDRGPPNHSAPPARLHEGDLYLCAESLAALEGALGGVCEAVDQVLGPGPAAAADANDTTAAPATSREPAPKRAFVAIRPPGHHCSASWPSGFCWINNVHVGINHAMLQHGLTHAAIVDFDLHHGDGSQAIAWQHNARTVAAHKNAAWWKKHTAIGYFSLHDINSFPCEFGDEEKVKNASLCIDNAHGQTIWNVHLEPWKTEAEFWALYETKYTALLDKLRGFLRAHTERIASLARASAAAAAPSSAAPSSPVAPKAAIFISAGFDASEWETSSMQRHKVNVPTEFYARFTRDVLAIADEEGTSVHGRVISVLEGGYSDRALFSGVLSHLSGLAAVDDSAAAVPPPPPAVAEEDAPAFRSGLGYEMRQRMRGSIGSSTESDARSRPGTASSAMPSAPAYDAAWWASGALDRIEAALAPPPPPPPPAAPSRHAMATTTYSSPTQSSQAKKATSTPKSRRSLSGLSSVYSGASPSSRPPSPPPPPPPPEVPWTAAFHELSKLLIPTERPTGSCTVEDLSAEATRARRDRQALLVASSAGVVDTVAATVPATAPATPSGPTRVSLRERKQVRPFGAVAAAGPSTPHAAVKEEDRRRTVGPGPTVSAATPRGRTPKVVLHHGRRLSAASTVVAADSSVGIGGGGGGGGGGDHGDTVPPVPQLPAVRPATATSATSASSRPASRPTSRPVSSSNGGSSTRPASRTSAGSGGSGKTSRGKRGTAAAAAAAATADDMDKLASGMRKIKINVVTTAQREAREKAKAEAAAQAAAEAAEAETKPVLSLPPASSDSAVPAAENARLPFAESTLAAAPAVFVPYQPEGVLAGEAEAAAEAQHLQLLQQPALPQQLHWLPPNEVATPGPAAAATLPTLAARSPTTPTTPTPAPMKRADLPVFTATSTIRFAGGALGTTPPKKEEE